ncbi:MAG: ribosome biogenesis GTPase Der [Ignavibacteriae bacterium]|nr:ribosome biogenesis GTPase Der [Ignavibacteriota bacterium]MCB9207114.1 ribosome biogenesis GTPase Der [Ignavibacteriales bacterium]MCB9209963.1 ribosome biogenesis GTPase Der [Ignavibacteriales bacterium]MCB9218652.1 ribosome biogenesis GTPase Der [Ignavibacteriales bacterium]MCB9259342.1 ribosome biogenesis GTPase Der [Ignavibacteriales bacterium]
MAVPLVVIVGRPNVGKSTLFNRLTRSKVSIVDDQSGVTRDRLYGDVEWNGKIFRLMDTGGYVKESNDKFEIAIKEQVEIAIDEADALLFVTDGRSGVTHLDNEVAALLRNTEKPTFILVNKADTASFENDKLEFYSFGIEDVYDISALNGRNTGDVLDDLIKKLNFPEDYLEEDQRLKIALLGKPNVGKSSLTNALLGYDRSIVTDIPGTTRDSINSILKYYGEEIVLVDTAGLRKKTKVRENIEFYSNVRTLRALSTCDIAIILVDAQTGIENQDQKIISEAIQRRKGIILAVNKWDLIDKETNTAKTFEIAINEKLGGINYLPVIFISALTKQRIYKLIDLAKEMQEERTKKIPTKVLNETMLEEIRKNPPPATKRGKEINIKFVSQVGEKYPIFLFFCSNSKEAPEHYRRFLENKIRSNFGFSGIPITVSFKEK